MAFTSLPSNSPSASSSSRVSVRKMHSQPALWAIATVSFLIGSTATALAAWQLHKLYRATVAPVVDVSGIVQAKYNYADDADELRPEPSGYFIESPGVGRVYLTGKPLDGYVGETVTANGSVSGVCGPKSIPCYPLVEVRDIRYVE